MRASIGKLGIAVAIAALVAGCGSEKPQLMQLRKTTPGPDEFAILPTKPLTMPENLALLPAPTPGGTNITDPSPQSDVIAALGGRPQAGSAASDGALLARASRFGTDAAIRGRLAAEDLEWRRANDGRLLERWFGVSSYLAAYKPMSLNQMAETERWRAVGMRTPAAPPSAEAQKAMP